MSIFKKSRTAAIDPKRLPVHIAIIMDGNGRWAKKRGLPRSAGHSAGASTFKSIARYCNQIGIRYLTVYAFSTENWKRSQDEVEGIMNFLREYLIDSANFKGENIRLKFIGDLNRLAPDILELIDKAEKDSEDATGLQVNIALNYGGRDEIVHAVRDIAKNVLQGSLNAEDITEQTVSDNLYTADMPDPDLVIRPSGEYRLSNYLIWQTAYSEFWFTDVLWPDFSKKELDEAIFSFSKRDRRFGNAK